jgi:hypothetical protein
LTEQSSYTTTNDRSNGSGAIASVTFEWQSHGKNDSIGSGINWEMQVLVPGLAGLSKNCEVQSPFSKPTQCSTFAFAITFQHY